MFERVRSRRALTEPHLSFGAWERLEPDSVVQICHPHWRGVRRATYGFGDLVVESADLAPIASSMAEALKGRRPSALVIQGWPPGAADLARALSSSDLRVLCVLHSSPAQHGAEAGEAAVADEVLALAAEGILAEVGMVKAGVSEAFRSLGHSVTHVPNRAPVLPPHASNSLGPGLNIGVFAEPFWRKNLTTQLLAVALMKGARAHVLRHPDNKYLDGLDIVEHGLLPYEDFIALQASVDLNLYVTLSECHPLTPQESYLSGVPCLMSQTSAVFREDPVLWEMTTVARLDDPTAIADAAEVLQAKRAQAVNRARAWIESADVVARETWEAFTGH